MQACINFGIVLSPVIAMGLALVVDHVVKLVTGAEHDSI
jgi:hypothetical protein